MEVIGQLHASAGLPPEKEPPVPVEQEAGSAPQPVWTFRIRKTSLPRPGIEPRTVQPVALCTDSGIRTYHDVCITSRSDFLQCILQITVCCLMFFYYVHCKYFTNPDSTNKSTVLLLCILRLIS